ncbi:MAG: 4-alpha-glucanotransferase [Steroidobacteraceae bacterium]
MNTPRILSRRRAGALLPLSALWREGSGALGEAALRFVDWLAEAGFSVWQVLPLVPVGEAGSPYWSRADRAGEPSLIDPREPDPGSEADLAAFRAAAAEWIEDYALFEALSREQGAAPWWLWPAPLRDREPQALAAAAARHARQIEGIVRTQWRFDAQWRRLREHAQARGIALFGDLPIYVAPDSVATWSDPAQFMLDAGGKPDPVAGVPPDYFAEDGQLWGNPLYNWPQHQRDGFAFWLRRLRLLAERFDLLRIDHFRGLAAYWAVPAAAATARAGQWIQAPGRQMLQRVTTLLPQLELVAEDLGVITPDVVALRRDFALPGMRVLQFGFDGDPANLHLPHHHDQDSVVYTGTHDNDTTVGWYAGLGDAGRDRVRRYLGRADDEVVDALRRAALASVGRLAVLPVQDILHLGSEARLNTPGTVTGNWSWRLPEGALYGDLARRYRELNGLYDRS